MNQPKTPPLPRSFRFHHAVLAAAVLFLAALGIVLFSPSEELRYTLSDTLWAATNLLAVAALLIAFRRSSKVSKRAGLGWGILALAQLSYSVGDLVWGYLEIFTDLPTFPSLADGFYLLYYPLFLAGVLFVASGRPSKAEWVKLILDISITMLAAALGFWYLLIGPLLAAGAEEGWLVQALTMAYPVGDLVLFSAFLVLLYGRRTRQSLNPIALLAAGILVTVIADSFFSYQSLTGTYISSSYVDLIWFVDYLLTGLAGVLQALQSGAAQAEQTTRSSELDTRPQDNWLTYFPYIWIIAAFGLLLASKTSREAVDAAYLTAGVGGIVALVLARQVIALQENTRLFHRVQQQAQVLADTNTELKAEIFERKRVEEQLAHDATHDALTGLPNRLLFFDRLGRAIQYNRRSDYPFAVLFLDLDQFKVINDSLGHSCGDELLAAVAQRLTACVRTADTVARLGGDEFAILLEDARNSDSVQKAASRVIEEIRLPFDLSGRKIFVTSSVGIVPSINGYARPEEVVRDADIAMYQAKTLGKDRCEVFDTGLRNQALSRLEMENDLRKAIDAHEFVLYYQPILELESGLVRGFEALLRWNHPEKGLILPDDFIPLAEETGLIVPIGQWVLHEACSQVKLWQERFPNRSAIHVNVNISGRQLSNPAFLEHVMTALLTSSLPPQSLVLEITETVLIEQGESASALFDKLTELGVHLQIDDFGTGYSSLSYLRHFPIQTIKIDQTFIQGIGRSEKNTNLVRTILSMAHDLGMEAVAEGVETTGQRDALQKFGCKFAQGFLLSIPQECTVVEKILAQESKSPE